MGLMTTCPVCHDDVPASELTSEPHFEEVEAYEEALTRKVPHQPGAYNLSTHFPWIGM